MNGEISSNFILDKLAQKWEMRKLEYEIENTLQSVNFTFSRLHLHLHLQCVFRLVMFCYIDLSCQRHFIGSMIYASATADRVSTSCRVLSYEIFIQLWRVLFYALVWRNLQLGYEDPRPHSRGVLLRLRHDEYHWWHDSTEDRWQAAHVVRSVLDGSVDSTDSHPYHCWRLCSNICCAPARRSWRSKWNNVLAPHGWRPATH